MNFLGIGPMELIFIIIIMILVLGPKNMITTAQKLGATLRKIVKSPMWATVMDTSREIREIPTRLIREAGIEEDMKTIRDTTDSIKKAGNVTVPYNVSTSDKAKEAKKPDASHLSTENVKEKSEVPKTETVDGEEKKETVKPATNEVDSEKENLTAKLPETEKSTAPESEKSESPKPKPGPVENEVKPKEKEE